MTVAARSESTEIEERTTYAASNVVPEVCFAQREIVLILKEKQARLVPPNFEAKQASTVKELV